jgi:amino-acid N-acetyltransferase
MMAWLFGARLATTDLDEGAPMFLASPDAEGATAFAGIAGSGPDRLLRSVVIDPAHRGRGAGRLLIAAIEAFAVHHGAERLWLLTDSASNFFGSIGYERRDRVDAPEVVRTSSQFKGLCSSSAVLMCKTLR